MAMVITSVPGEEVASSSSRLFTRFPKLRKAVVVIAASDIAAAAHELLCLSGVESRGCLPCERDDYSSSSDQSVTSKMIIEEIFGKEDEEVEEKIEEELKLSETPQRKRKRKYRSLKSIYEDIPRISNGGSCI